ncbi:MAG: RIP metalloprotease RseP [Verrucomicrobiota bacterium]
METIFDVFRGIGLILLVILIFNVVILVHEWGHFLAARWRGLQIDKFQIWFGKALWKKEINGVQYGLGCIPAGGFVALPQMGPMELIEGKSDKDGNQLPTIAPIDKIIVAFAGPLFSFLLAVVIAIGVWQIGYPASKAGNSTVIGVVVADRPAAEAGILAGDKILKIDGNEVKTFAGMVDSIQWSVMSGRSDIIEVELERDGEILQLQVNAPIPKHDPETKWHQRLFTRPPLRTIGVGPKDTPVMFGKIIPNGPAEQAGIQKNDELVTFNSKELFNFAGMSQEIAKTQDQPVELQVRRGGELMDFTVQPRRFDDFGDYDPEWYPNPMLGISPPDRSDAEVYARETEHMHPTPYELISSTLRMMYNTITAVASPKSGVKPGHMSGPAGIMNTFFQLLKAPEGWKLVLWFSVILNINLAVLNMLPLPVLDGGHITTALFELISRRTVHIRVQEAMTLACFVLLVGFMLYVTKFDAGDIFEMNKPTKELKEPSFLPSSAAANEAEPSTAPSPG